MDKLNKYYLEKKHNNFNYLLHFIYQAQLKDTSFCYELGS